MSEPKPKKMVSRNIAIALGITCFVLIATIGVIWLHYLVQDIEDDEKYSNYVATHSHEDSEYASLSSQVTTLQDQLDSDNSMLNILNSSVTSLQEQVTNLQNQANSLHIWGTGNSIVLINNETGIESDISRAWNLGNLSAAGYVSVLVSSNNTSTDVGVYYASNGTDYAYQTIVGLGGIAVFPVLPNSIMTTVIVGNSYGETSTYAVTITYYT